MADSSNTEWVERQQRVFTPNYRPSIALTRGEGMYVWDVEGTRYLDMLSGLAVNVFGHCHPEIVGAARNQLATLAHVSNLYTTEPAVALAERLVSDTAFDRVFLCNSGTEAIEAALKLARLYARKIKGEDRFEVVAAARSFHGRSFGSLSATGQPKYHDGFAPLVPGFRHAPYGDLQGFADKIGEKTAAVLVEALQGEGGVRPAPDGFLHGLRTLCDDRGALLIVDEIQTGMGRTGHFFAHEHQGIEPDLVTMAKGLGAGLPIGALLAKEAVGMAMVPGTHATTFGGNPVVCAAALAGLELLDRSDLTAHAAARGAQIAQGMAALVARHEHVVARRGWGLLQGLELAIEARPTVDAMAKAGILIGGAGPNVIRLAPPLIVGEEQIDTTMALLDDALVGRLEHA